MWCHKALNHVELVSDLVTGVCRVLQEFTPQCLKALLERAANLQRGGSLTMPGPQMARFDLRSGVTRQGVLGFFFGNKGVDHADQVLICSRLVFGVVPLKVF